MCSGVAEMLSFATAHGHHEFNWQCERLSKERQNAKVNLWS